MAYGAPAPTLDRLPDAGGAGGRGGLGRGGGWCDALGGAIHLARQQIGQGLS